MRILITEKQLNKIILEQSTSGTTTQKRLPYQTFTNEDTEEYNKILSGIGAPINTETLGFMYAWRQGESSLGSEEKFYCNNPFSTTWSTDSKEITSKGIKPGQSGSTMYSRTNSHHVRSYKTIDWGVYATIKTINKNFPQISQVLKTPGLNCLQMAQKLTDSLNRWGTTGAAVSSICQGYLKGKTPQPRPINRNQGCY
jgi:hypothetical protein